MGRLAAVSGLAPEIRQMGHSDSAAVPSLDRIKTLLLNFSVQIKKKSQQKAKQEERMSKEFMKMEAAAMQAYQDDLKRMEREAAGRFSNYVQDELCSFNPD